jgi:hypothetical protein
MQWSEFSTEKCDFGALFCGIHRALWPPWTLAACWWWVRGVLLAVSYNTRVQVAFGLAAH